jgi:hypothetical protein
VLAERNVLRDSRTYFKVHALLHFFARTTTVQNEKDGVDEDQEQRDKDNDFCVDGRVQLRLVVGDVFFFVELDANVGLGLQTRTDCLENVFGGHVFADSLPVYYDRRPVVGAVLVPLLGLFS